MSLGLATAKAAAGPLLNHWVRSSHVGVIEFNSPSNRNALSAKMLHRFHDTIKLMESNPSVRVVVVQAVGPAFSSGHDLKEIRSYQQQSDAGGREEMRRLFRKCSDVMSSIVSSPLPFVAKVNGVATAAGCQLVASCDLAYATSDRSRFATPGVKIGLFCSTPAVALGRCVPRKSAMEMLLTGGMIDAAKAERIGLINEALPDEAALDARVDEVADLIATESSPEAIRVGKPAFVRQMNGGPRSLEEAYEWSTAVMCENALDEECVEGVDAFLGKRPPIWGSREIDVSEDARR